MNALIQEITQIIQDLSPDQLIEVRDYVEFTLWKQQQLWKQQHPLPEIPAPETIPHPKLTNEEFRQRLDDLADRFKSYVDPDLPPLSDYAVSREGIYGDHL
jgi:hypothetical protein